PSTTATSLIGSVIEPVMSITLLPRGLAARSMCPFQSQRCSASLQFAMMSNAPSQRLSARGAVIAASTSATDSSRLSPSDGLHATEVMGANAMVKMERKARVYLFVMDDSCLRTDAPGAGAPRARPGIAIRVPIDRGG